MDRIAKALKGKKGFIGYVTGADPTIEATEKIIHGMIKGGTDLVEIGIPYSDPLADGPTIQAAALRALENPLKTDDFFDLVARIRKSSETPIVFLVYYNSIFSYGVNNFAKKCNEVGVDGLIVPDLPLEESLEFPRELVALIPLVAPNSKDRIKDIVEKGDGFVYCISSFGVTGTRSSISSGTKALVEEVKKYTDLPVAVGFGISSREMVEEVHEYADAAIVGSSIVKVVEANGGCAVKVEEYVSSLAIA